MPGLPPGAVPFAAGREADVFALDDGRVLRRYRHDADVSHEARIMAYVRGLGFPVPEVFAAAGTDLVLERLTGPTVVEALVAGVIDVGGAAELMAGLLRHLHELPPEAGAPPGSSLLHLDLHTENVLLTERGPMVIDWRNAAYGDGDLDTALSALIIAQFGADATEPLAGVANEYVEAFLAVAPGDPLRLVDEAAAYRAAQTTMSREETARLGPAVARMRAAAGRKVEVD